LVLVPPKFLEELFKPDGHDRSTVIPHRDSLVVIVVVGLIVDGVDFHPRGFPDKTVNLVATAKLIVDVVFEVIVVSVCFESASVLEILR